MDAPQKIADAYQAIKNNGLPPSTSKDPSILGRGASGANMVAEGASTVRSLEKGEYFDTVTHAAKAVSGAGGLVGNKELKERAEAVGSYLENWNKTAEAARQGDNLATAQYGLQGIGAATKLINKDVGSGLENTGKAVGVVHDIQQINSEINVLEQRMDHTVDGVISRSQKYRDLQNLRRMRSELLQLQNAGIRLP
jgi:hypothetical protein